MCASLGHHHIRARTVFSRTPSRPFTFCSLVHITTLLITSMLLSTSHERWPSGKTTRTMRSSDDGEQRSRRSTPSHPPPRTPTLDLLPLCLNLTAGIGATPPGRNQVTSRRPRYRHRPRGVESEQSKNVNVFRPRWCTFGNGGRVLASQRAHNYEY